MARKSRKDIPTQLQNQAKIQVTMYNTAIYARLSKEDIRADNDCSIETQTEFVKKYISQKPYLKLCSIFSDNGLTGTNFNRPSFINMIEEIKNGNINCIVVKDLSRFGREYIEVGNYIEKIFPFMNVRFISINDNYDSFDPNCDKESLTISLKSLIHDLYAKDISVKIKSALDTKRKNGEFIGNYPPYGYTRNIDNKSQFYIDEETAPVVRDIFNYKMEGLSYSAIAKKLNERNILSPSNYAYKKGFLKGEKFSKLIYWQDYAVKRILCNQTYIGDLVQGKVQSDIQLGIKQGLQEQDNWFICEGSHEAIIEKELFYKVQALLLEVRNKALENKGKYDNYEKKENIFKGVLTCGYCDRSIKRYCYTAKNNKMKYRYYCNYCNKYNKEIKSVFMTDEDLFNVVKMSVTNEIQIFVDFQNLILKMRESENTKTKLENINKNIFLTKQSVTKKETMLKSIYEDFKEQLLSREEYNFAKERYVSEHSTLSQRLEELIFERSTFSDNFINDNKFVQAINCFKKDFSISKELIEKLIEKVIVNYDRSIEIQYKFKNEYLSIIKFAKDNGVQINE